MDVHQQRILVIGTSCSGKTTFSRRLGEALQLPVVELDQFHWAPNWQEAPRAEFVRRAGDATSGPAWIADGNYQSIRETLWPRATHVVWLNYRWSLVLWRGLKRSLRRSLTGEELWHGNRESLRRTFCSHDSILLWIITTHRRRQAEFTAVRQSGEYPQLQWIEFRDPGSADSWLTGPAAAWSGDERVKFEKTA